MSHPDELLKAREEQLNWTKRAEVGQVQTVGLDRGDKPAQPHPREILLSDLNDQEQRLLDRLHALRELRQEILCLSREDGERVMKMSRLAERANGQPRNF